MARIVPDPLPLLVVGSGHKTKFSQQRYAGCYFLYKTHLKKSRALKIRIFVSYHEEDISTLDVHSIVSSQLSQWKLTVVMLQNSQVAKILIVAMTVHVQHGSSVTQRKVVRVKMDVIM